MHKNTKLRERVEYLGACCPKEFFRTHSTFSTEELAAILGLKSRTIRFWRAKVRSISGCKTCFHA